MLYCTVTVLMQLFMLINYYPPAFTIHLAFVPLNIENTRNLSDIDTP